MGPARHVVTWATVVAIGIQSIIPSTVLAGGWRSEPTTVEVLARKVDKLQRHLDDYGVIVAKTPDVWGESRLLKHREEFEEEMSKELDKFKSTLQASQQTRDAAFLASSLSLQVSGTPAATTPPSQNVSAPSFINVGTTQATTDSSPPTQLTLPRNNFSTKGDFTGMDKEGAASPLKSISLEPVKFLDQKKRYLDHLNALRRLNEGDDVADSPGYALNLMRIPVSVLPGTDTREGYGAEIKISLEPMASDELLRQSFRNFVINGVADRLAPIVTRGANLKKSDIEDLESAWETYVYTVVLGSYINNELSFSSRKEKAIVNDVLEKLKSKVEKSLTEDSDNPKLKDLKELLENVDYSDIKDLRDASVTMKQKEKTSVYQSGRLRVDPEGEDLKEQQQKFQLQQQKIRNLSGNIQKYLISEALNSGIRIAREDINNTLSSGDNSSNPKRPFSISQDNAVNGTNLIPVILAVYKALRTDRDSDSRGDLHLEDVRRFLVQEVAASYEMLSQPIAAEFWSSICNEQLIEAVKSYRRKDADNVIKSALVSYRQASVVHSLPGMVRDPDTTPITLSEWRRYYYKTLEKIFPETLHSMTGHLGWQILVESAMLDDRLQEDMRQVAVERECNCLVADGLSFSGPNPDPMACEAFRQYVQCRWPVKVFALDPVTDDQNVADEFSQRREMQLALAVAASRSLIGASNLTQYARRLEYDLSTIEIHRTAVGFNMGRDSFGWRFYPRVQTPPVPGNLSTVTRDLLIGQRSKDSDLIKRRLEPGIRECVALVVMPSFIPNMKVDIQTSWFRLGNCNNGHTIQAKVNQFGRKLNFNFGREFNDREMELVDAVRLSEQLTEVRCLSQQCLADHSRYRSEDLRGIMKAIERLDHQLPLQTEQIQIPFENDLTGFEIFNSGITDLGPELIDWYGAPGILVAQETKVIPASKETSNAADAATKAAKSAEDAKKAAEEAKTAAAAAASNKMLAITGPTTVFLVGKNFSSLGAATRIIAGGIDVTETKKVVSRRVISVVIPQTALISGAGEEAHVDIHLATPHGVTSSLGVPVYPKPVKTKSEQASTDQTALKELSTKVTSIQGDVTTLKKNVKALQDIPVPVLSWRNHVGELCIDQCQPIAQKLTIANPTTFTLELKTPPFTKASSNVDLAFDVAASTDGKKFTQVQNSGRTVRYFFPTSYQLNDKNQMDLSAADLTAGLIQALDGNVLFGDIKKLKLNFYARSQDGTKKSDWPVYKVSNSLEFTVKQCDTCAPAAAPPAGAVSLPQSPNRLSNFFAPVLPTLTLAK